MVTVTGSSVARAATGLAPLQLSAVRALWQRTQQTSPSSSIRTGLPGPSSWLVLSREEGNILHGDYMNYGLNSLKENI